MRLLLDDSFATSTYTAPLVAGWVDPPEVFTVELVPRLTADNVAADDAALVPSSALLHLQASHEVVDTVAVIADGVGAVAMRTPTRPDEIEATPVRLLDTSGTAELLAKATLRPFYGIRPTAWVRAADAPDAASAEVVIVEGAEALREPEAGFSEDLGRAWFILTAQPVVSHVLLVPRDVPPTSLAAVIACLDAARGAGVERRRDWRPQLADGEGVGRDRASAFWAAQRLTLEAADRRALLDLLAQGSRGTSNSSPLNVRFREGAGAV